MIESWLHNYWMTPDRELIKIDTDHYNWVIENFGINEVALMKRGWVRISIIDRLYNLGSELDAEFYAETKEEFYQKAKELEIKLLGIKKDDLYFEDTNHKFIYKRSY